MSSKSLWLGVFIGALCLVLSSNVASAQKRIVVLEIEGSRSGALRDSLTRLIRPNKSLNDNTYRNAARRLRAPKLNPKSVAKVARYLEADGVLDGILVAKDGEYKFTVRLRSGRDGTIVATIPMTLSKPRLSDKMQRGLRSRLIDAIDELPAMAGMAGAEDEGFDDESGFDDEDGDDADESGDDEGFDAADDESKEGFGDEDEDEEDDEDEEEEDDDEEEEEDDDFVDDVDKASGAASGVEDPRMRQVIVMAGLSVSKRTLTFSVAQGLENPPPGYASGTVPGAYINGVVYPLMKKRKDGKATLTDNLGITFMYDRVLQIETNVQDEDMGAVVAVPTSAERYAIGGAYRMLLGKGHSKPSLTFLAAYNSNSFVIDKAMSPSPIDVPNTEYTWIDPGVRFRMGVSAKAAVHAEAHALLVLDTGEMQEPEQYGAAKVTGVDADVGVEYWITSRYLLRGGARYTALGYDYQGNGALNDRDGDNEVDVGGALDAYLGGYVTVGAAF